MLMDGKELARDIKVKIKAEIDNIKKIHNINPMVATILVGDDPASQVYLNSQVKSYQDLGIGVQKYFFSEEISEAYLLNLIDKLNKDTEVDGIMINLPLPPQINATKVLNSIKLIKDVDGFKAENLGLLFQNNEGFTSPSTPAGIMALIEKYNIDLEGKDVVVVGSSNIVGKPIAALILNSRGTVTICNIYTKNLAEKTKNADILISAVGKAKLITEDMVKEGAVVIDVGINRVNGKLEGDVDFENVQKKASHITPVPGGVGALTVAMLLSNILKSFKANRGII
ncbi:bifunctional methylenetetrahydrofolate dehydrogenase/methenyltetrahydrofolate cyclohydrolase [Fusobacterium nucleatum subsp. nucleatum ATCC 25586]|uniref:Bifunctional protein FolD n=2 Tax=Fusobacterium nucleatum subsp. nucleatum (strain ATCC 25586 / DSM 15643 / BCRC 10681 / CIP 101130 / JCM 8532 / KCTC 2640 / LMG 13131 / VPI 4355) TaxID=190304 RepID=FOLD_FUSNN|nr:bifunctional 5,10-methylenetetrahydrofolate dehydrogenase/5,10-methenyltetrahydrofolate cyclohydrolase [Fusobacterium nucleatum]Q8RDM4.1 RecName: Full=Bifunctional protein FolD; Includes: RecName: Full=Methylenetetrahydrofolate dehydrogenase; Includes: RecName: Full=Methenyltetrahydrofolate cyclohydrolase [Fusobacterium nucleatum subsp. nucleatum ATCC 25586]AAL95682.1 Methylenetetrahydrofolate dehydrogenase (NADP+) [Fusobacterium nucleatum subsp. nucleatum ATCC 25586]AVQ15770.1 bifunctional m